MIARLLSYVSHPLTGTSIPIPHPSIGHRQHNKERKTDECPRDAQHVETREDTAKDGERKRTESNAEKPQTQC
jgi:hypothetical protein